MSAAVTRLLSVVYGSLTIGGTSDYHIDGPWRLNKVYERFSFSCEVVLAADSNTNEAAFLAWCTAVETAFRKPRQKLEIFINGSTYFSADPVAGASGNTGFDQFATCDKIGDETTDSGRSRRYRVTVEGTLPADLSGVSGRRRADITMDFAPSRRGTVTIEGEYTALGASDALAVYNAGVATFATSVLAGITGTFELVSEKYKRNDTDKTLTFTRVYRELLLNQSIGVLNNPAIVEQVITVTVRQLAPGDSPIGTPIIAEVGDLYTDGEVARPIRIELTAAMSIDKTVTTDMTALWNGTIKPWLIQHAMTVAGTAFMAIEEISRIPTHTDNTIAASLRALAIAGPVLEHVFTVEIDDDTGLKHTGVHGPDPLVKHNFQGERFVVRTARQNLRLLKGMRGGGGGGNGPQGGGQGAGPAGGIGVGIGAGLPGSFLGGWAQGTKPGISNGTIGFGIGAGPPGSLFDEFMGLDDALEGGGGGGGGAGGVPEKPFNSGNLNDLSIKAPPGAEGAVWDRKRFTQAAQPDRIGIDGFQIDTVVLTLTAIDWLRKKPEEGGGGSSTSTAASPRQ